MSSWILNGKLGKNKRRRHPDCLGNILVFINIFVNNSISEKVIHDLFPDPDGKYAGYDAGQGEA